MLPDRMPLLADIVYQQFPWRAAVRAAYAQGRLPLWNPSSLLGEPLLATQQPAPFHPGVWLGMLLPLPQAWSFDMTLRLLIALLCAYLFLRGLWCRESSALIGALGWAFSNWMVFYLGLQPNAAAAPFPLSAAGTAPDLPRTRSQERRDRRRRSLVDRFGRPSRDAASRDRRLRLLFPVRALARQAGPAPAAVFHRARGGCPGPGALGDCAPAAEGSVAAYGRAVEPDGLVCASGPIHSGQRQPVPAGSSGDSLRGRRLRSGSIDAGIHRAFGVCRLAPSSARPGRPLLAMPDALVLPGPGAGGPRGLDEDAGRGRPREASPLRHRLQRTTPSRHDVLAVRPGGAGGQSVAGRRRNARLLRRRGREPRLVDVDVPAFSRRDGGARDVSGLHARSLSVPGRSPRGCHRSSRDSAACASSNCGSRRAARDGRRPANVGGGQSESHPAEPDLLSATVGAGPDPAGRPVPDGCDRAGIHPECRGGLRVGGCAGLRSDEPRSTHRHLSPLVRPSTGLVQPRRRSKGAVSLVSQRALGPDAVGCRDAGRLAGPCRGGRDASRREPGRPAARLRASPGPGRARPGAAPGAPEVDRRLCRSRDRERGRRELRGVGGQRPGSRVDPVLPHGRDRDRGRCAGGGRWWEPPSRHGPAGRRRSMAGAPR